MGRYDKEKGRWVTLHEDAQEALSEAATHREQVKLRASEVLEEQAEWDGKVLAKPILRCCANCHSIVNEGSNCGLQGHEYGCPKCDADGSF